MATRLVHRTQDRTCYTLQNLAQCPKDLRCCAAAERLGHELRDMINTDSKACARGDTVPILKATMFFTALFPAAEIHLPTLSSHDKQ